MKFAHMKRFNEALERKFNKGFQDGYKGSTGKPGDVSGLFKYAYLAGHREGQKLKGHHK